MKLTLGNKSVMRLKIACIILTFLSLNSFVLARDLTNIRSTPSESFFEILLEASKIDGNNGITITELESMIGPSDNDNSISQWNGGIKYTYYLNNDNKLIVDSLSGNIMHVFFVEKDGSRKILWK